MKRVCKKCGVVYEGRSDSVLCPACAKESKASIYARPRTCKSCGAVFLGGPRAWYCPECREERRKERERKYHRDGPARKIGSVSHCEVCGNEYTVWNGNQKYCPDCAAEAVAKIKRASSIAWNHANVDLDQQREDRRASVAPIPCAVCGKMFTPSSGSLTCSEECARKHAAKKASEYEASHKEQRNKYHMDLVRAKEAAMTPEEYEAYREGIRKRARENYAKRKAKKDTDA